MLGVWDGAGAPGGACQGQSPAPLDLRTVQLSSFTMKTYVHATDDDLKQGRQALAKIHHIV